jgi:hypothetical protein
MQLKDKDIKEGQGNKKMKAEYGSNGDGGDEWQAEMSDEEAYLSQTMRDDNRWERDERMIDAM